MDFGWTIECPICRSEMPYELMSLYGPCESCYRSSLEDTSLDLAELIRNRKASFKRARRFASRRAI